MLNKKEKIFISNQDTPGEYLRNSSVMRMATGTGNGRHGDDGGGAGGTRLEVKCSSHKQRLQETRCSADSWSTSFFIHKIGLKTVPALKGCCRIKLVNILSVLRIVLAVIGIITTTSTAYITGQ